VPAINRARTVVFLVSGAGKEAIVRSVLEGTKGEDRSLPATMIRPAQGRLIWFLDRAAAAGLTIAKQGMVSHEE
jgi:6-phosphogluconolactonase